MSPADTDAYRVEEFRIGASSEKTHYANLDDAIQHVEDAADRDGWRLVDDEEEFPWATDRSRQVVIIPIHIRDEYRGLPDGGDGRGA